MKIFIIIFLSLTIIISINLYAQVNTEKYRNENDTTGFSGSVQLNISAQTGNVDLQELNPSLGINYKTERTNSFAVILGEYGWKDQEAFSNQALFHIRHVHEISFPFDWEVFAQINYDKTRLLLFRDLAGGGLRFNIIKNKSNEFWIGTDYMREHEKYDLPSTAKHKAEQTVNRWSNYLTYSVIVKNGVNFSSVIYYQPRFDQFNDLKILNENSLSVALINNLTLTVGFRLYYNSRPPDAIKNTDTKTEMGFSYGF